jgi:hypothetical protein
MERYGKASMFTAGAAAVLGVLGIWVALEVVGWRRRSQRAPVEADKDSILEVREAA